MSTSDAGARAEAQDFLAFVKVGVVVRSAWRCAALSLLGGDR